MKNSSKHGAVKNLLVESTLFTGNPTFLTCKGSLVGKIKSLRVKSGLEILIGGLLIELQPFCPIYGAKLTFCVFLTLPYLLQSKFCAGSSFHTWVSWLHQKIDCNTQDKKSAGSGSQINQFSALSSSNFRWFLGLFWDFCCLCILARYSVSW